MKEEVYHTHYYNQGIRVDRQLLTSLENVFRQYNQDCEIEIEIECENSASYKFDSIDECFGYFERIPYRIAEMEITVKYGDSLNHNKTVLTFSNEYFQSVKIRYQFDKVDDYLLQKEKIEQCMNNYKLSYYILSKIPLLAILISSAFFFICIYTNEKGIVFSQLIQYIIIIIWIGGSIISTFAPMSQRIKRNLFPLVEFRIGQNEIGVRNNEKIRGFILISFAFALFLGIVVNAISKFLFH